ncbi:sensor histidine kinase [Paenibacillus spongiae]|uniref:histidine kinase n=1 Tax=Paenibacillus spongiae TaxID=2909671 RepID=A0ABY5SHB8_9BACL|nr:sensor histidine kinase [Paenibacillus spongiae]UVI33386.1 sensor histidine kinase [Paenibacillus spongiae]
MRIHRKLMIVYFLMNLLLTAILSTLFLKENESISAKSLSQFYDGVLSQQINNIRYKQQIYENLAVQFVLSPAIEELLESDPDVLQKKNFITLHNEIDRLVGYLYSFHDTGIRSIQLFHRSERVPSDGKFLFPLSRLQAVYTDEELKSASSRWKLMADPVSDKYYWSFVQPINSMKMFNNIGYVQIVAEISSFINTESSPASLKFSEESTESFIMDSSGTVVLHPEEERIGRPVDATLTTLLREKPAMEALEDTVYTIDEEEYVVLWKPISSLNWTSIALVPKRATVEAFHHFRNVLILTLFLSTAVFFLVSYLITKRMMNGLKTLHKKVLALGRSKEMYAIDVTANKGRDEISLLERSFDSMTHNLRQLIHENYIVKLNKREMELKFLQTQINSHFLYNTLDSIKNEIDLDERETAVKMITALADLFRVSVSHGKEMIRFEEEIYHARCYLEIIEHRFGYSYEFDWRIDPDILPLYTLKVVLQPILENAIFHGLVPKKTRGVITIEGQLMDDAVEIRISDNGIGMPPEVSRRLEEGTLEGQGVGLSNVLNRIRVYFGDTYGLHIESVQKVGTKVTLRLPIRHREEDAHVPLARS